MSHLLDTVQMKSLACIMHLRDKPSQMLFRQAFVSIASQLELDDVGYFYDPKHPDRLLTVPGQMVGAMNNTWLPTFSFGIAVKTTISVLNSLDSDYQKLLIIVTDYAKQTDAYYFEQALEQDQELKVIFYTFGNKCDQSLLDICAKNQKIEVIHDDINNVETLLSKIII